MTPATDPDRLDSLVRAADPAAGRSAPPVDDRPLALAALRAGLRPPARPAGAADPGGPVGAADPARPAGPGASGLVGASGPDGAFGPVPGPGWGRARPARGWVPVAASVVAVLVVVGLAAVVSRGQPLGGSPAGSAGLTQAPAPGGAGKPGGGEHTASAGPEYDRAMRLLAALQGAVPAGYTVPAGGTGSGTYPTSGPGSTLPTIGPDGTGMPAAYFQAVRDEGPYEGYQGYEYMADTIVSEGPRVGSLAVRVWKGVPAWSEDPCVVLHRVYWNTGDECQVLTTPGGTRVAVVDAAVGETDRRESQWAGHRRPDGTVVLVAQGPGVLNDRIPGLDRPVFTPAGLAALAAGERFVAAVR